MAWFAFQVFTPFLHCAFVLWVLCFTLRPWVRFRTCQLGLLQALLWDWLPCIHAYTCCTGTVGRSTWVRAHTHLRAFQMPPRNTLHYHPRRFVPTACHQHCLYVLPALCYCCFLPATAHCTPPSSHFCLCICHYYFVLRLVCWPAAAAVTLCYSSSAGFLLLLSCLLAPALHACHSFSFSFFLCLPFCRFAPYAALPAACVRFVPCQPAFPNTCLNCCAFPTHGFGCLPFTFPYAPAFPKLVPFKQIFAMRTAALLTFLLVFFPKFSRNFLSFNFSFLSFFLSATCFSKLSFSLRASFNIHNRTGV